MAFSRGRIIGMTVSQSQIILSLVGVVVGYGGITVNNRVIISIPFGTPDGDITLLISDWYIKSHEISMNFYYLLLVDELIIFNKFDKISLFIGITGTVEGPRRWA
ncbi:L-ascorbate oxidase-like protein [Bienertia sinuspersici]